MINQLMIILQDRSRKLQRHYQEKSAFGLRAQGGMIALRECMHFLQEEDNSLTQDTNNKLQQHIVVNKQKIERNLQKADAKNTQVMHAILKELDLISRIAHYLMHRQASEQLNNITNQKESDIKKMVEDELDEAYEVK